MNDKLFAKDKKTAEAVIHIRKQFAVHYISNCLDFKTAPAIPRSSNHPDR